MRRKFLENLGLEKEAIDKILRSWMEKEQKNAQNCKNSGHFT